MACWCVRKSTCYTVLKAPNKFANAWSSIFLRFIVILLRPQRKYYCSILLFLKSFSQWRREWLREDFGGTVPSASSAGQSLLEAKKRVHGVSCTYNLPHFNMAVLVCIAWADTGLPVISINFKNLIANPEIFGRQSGCSVCLEQFGDWSTVCWLRAMPCYPRSLFYCWLSTSMHA